MNNKPEILEELNEIAPLIASINKTEVYSVPDNYFDNFSAAVLLKVKLLSSEQNDELSEIAPVLSSIGRQNVYEIPNNYFESFKVNIPAAAPDSKIVPLKRINRFIKYAVAAVAVGVVFTVSLLYDHYSSNGKMMNVANAVKNLSDDELNQYAEENSIQLNYDSLAEDDTELNVASELKTVTNEELEQYYNSEHLQVISQEN